MVTSTVHLNPATETTAPEPQKEWFVFEFIQRHDRAFLLTPFFMAALMIALHHYGSPEIRQTVEWMTGISR